MVDGQQSFSLKFAVGGEIDINLLQMVQGQHFIGLMLVVEG